MFIVQQQGRYFFVYFFNMKNLEVFDDIPDSSLHTQPLPALPVLRPGSLFY
jgi:hypothetical protein